MADLIDRQNAIDVICLSWCGCQNSNCKHHFDPEVDESYWCDGCGDVEELKNIPSAQPEPLTDAEQRIFLAAMSREKTVCKLVDEEGPREPYEKSLVETCHEIIRKVKGALWT